VLPFLDIRNFLNNLKQPSRSVTNEGGQQYTPVNRNWATPTKPDSHQLNPQSGNAETRTTSNQVDAQYLSPVERWEREDLRQSQWNNIASYIAMCNAVDYTSSQKMQGQGDNWSMTGNAQSEK
jgi:hypothetical protein